MALPEKHFYDFGLFRLDASERLLLRAGKEIPLTPKQFEILLALVRRAGHIVEKEQLMQEVWPDTFVEEGNLKVNISGLRRILGDSPEGASYIETIPRRGYRFVARVEQASEEEPPLIIERHTRARITRREVGAKEVEGDAEYAQIARVDVVDESRALPGVAAAKSSPLLRVVLGAAVLLLLAGVAAFEFVRARHRGLPERVSMVGRTLYAWNSEGRVAWQYELPVGAVLAANDAPPSVEFADLNADGSREVLLLLDDSAKLGTPLPGTTLYCFSAKGDLLWTYRPKFKLHFGGREFSGPWHASAMLVSPEPGTKDTWVAFTHHTWWPSFVVKLDPRGEANLQFRNSGWIQFLGFLRNSAGPQILAAGISNEYNSAFLAAFSEDVTPTEVPQTPNSPYFCDDCPRIPGNLQFFLFPPTEIHALQNIPFHSVLSLNVSSEGVEVQTLEARDSTYTPQEMPGVYDFTPDLELRSAAFGDAYWNLHRRLEKEGKIHHSAAQCSDRDPANHMSAMYRAGQWTRPRRFLARY